MVLWLLERSLHALKSFLTEQPGQRKEECRESLDKEADDAQLRPGQCYSSLVPLRKLYIYRGKNNGTFV